MKQVAKFEDPYGKAYLKLNEWLQKHPAADLVDIRLIKNDRYQDIIFAIIDVPTGSEKTEVVEKTKTIDGSEAK